MKSNEIGRTFRGGQLLQIAMPMGGIGAGCVCLSGYGALQDWSLYHKPAISAANDGPPRPESAFALLHIKGDKPITKLIEGSLPVEKIYDGGLQSLGYRHGGYEGLPRFSDCTFVAEYPFGHVQLSHDDVPLKVTITGFSPMIPLDDKNSGIPAAILEYRLENPTAKAVEYEFSYHLSHLAVGASGYKSTRNAVIPGFGVHFTNTEKPTDESFGSSALGVIGHSPKIKPMWFRGSWFDWIGVLWREVSEGKFTEDHAAAGREADGMNGGSILLSGKLQPGESVVYPVVIAWHLPNCHKTEGVPAAPVPAADCVPGSGCCEPTAPGPKWRPYYVSQWSDAAAVAGHVRENYSQLRSKTRAFRDALASSTIPAEVLDAVSSNLAILQSPTVMRQENGNVWAWEGCFTTHGCCHGSCTHVWNYAQAIPHLFPKLERTLREQELQRSMDEQGHVNFRAALPDGPTSHDYHPAADGQLGGIMKLYREWQISGDTKWMTGLYPLAKLSIDFCINRWDPRRRGAIIEPHHNTYDIEFWGPDALCTSIYLGALAAIAAMGKVTGDPDAGVYQKLAATGAAYADEQLYNGEYYHQRVTWADLQDQGFAKLLATHDDSDPSVKLQRAEGPKYQYGPGCLSDAVLGSWMATLYGIDSPLNQAKVRSTLASIFKHNFKKDLSDHACTQRPGYATGKEPGLLLCSWPRGGKPTLPFVYSDEVWTGIEYQVASHLIEEGFVEEGLTVVRAARSRFEGHVRNPFNEYECGSYYARALASYALLQALSGFRYSAITRTLWFGPRVKDRPFRIFFSTAAGYGTILLEDARITVDLLDGELAIDTLELQGPDGSRKIAWNTLVKAGQPSHKAI